MSERVGGLQTGAVTGLSGNQRLAGKPTFGLRNLFSRRWILATVLVAAAIALTVRLGFWQLDRLSQRRAFNARVTTQLQAPVLLLSGDALHLDLISLEYRAVKVRGVYDFDQQIALRNQAWENQSGVHLITPLHIEGADQVVLVDRGWVPAVDFTSTDWEAYDEAGMVEVQGMIRAAQDKPDFGRRSDPLPGPGEPPLKLWNFVNVQAIAQQLPYPLLPVYIQQAPRPSWIDLPYRTQPVLDLSEGPHQGYALQWFTFALLLLVGYPLFAMKRSKSSPTSAELLN